MNVALTKLPAHGGTNWSPSPASDTGTNTGTWIGCFRTEDHLTWRSTDGVWQAQLERSASGGHVSLAFFCREVYLGRYDHRGSLSRPIQPSASSLAVSGSQLPTFHVGA